MSHWRVASFTVRATVAGVHRGAAVPRISSSARRRPFLAPLRSDRVIDLCPGLNSNGAVLVGRAPCRKDGDGVSTPGRSSDCAPQNSSSFRRQCIPLQARRNRNHA